MILRFAKHVSHRLSKSVFRNWTYTECGGKDQAIEIAKLFEKLCAHFLTEFDCCTNKDKREELLKKHGAVKIQRTIGQNRTAMEQRFYESKSPVMEETLHNAIAT